MSAPTTAPTTSRWRKTLTWLALILGLCVLGWQLRRFDARATVVVGDFVEYWAAGRLCWQGENPYALELLAPLQQSAGSSKPRPLLMHNPPWALTLVLPFALLDYGPARLAWTLFLLAVLLLSTDLLWHVYAGPPKQRWLAWVLGLFFAPALFALNIGQISPLLLLGLAGFLWFAHREQWFWAGVAATLLTIKPQLFYLLWPALAFWVVATRRWQLVGGGILGVAAGLVLPLLLRPDVIGDYVRASLTHPPERWITPTLGAVLRLQWGWDKLWLQFFPPLLGTLLALALYFRCRQRPWRWQAQIHGLLFFSLLTTAYSWSHDQILLLAPVIATIAPLLSRHRYGLLGSALGGYLLLNLVAFVIHFLELNELWYIWIAPAWLLWYALLHWQGRDEA